MPPRHRHHVFLAVKEGLQNVLKHARATQVEVTLRLAQDELQVELFDDGCGFDETKEDDMKGHGLRNLQERMDRVGGSVAISSKSGRGTRLVFSIPIVGMEPGEPEDGAGNPRAKPGFSKAAEKPRL